MNILLGFFVLRFREDVLRQMLVRRTIMRKAITLLGTLTLLVCAAPTVFSRPAPQDSTDSIIIVFKDGHRQSFLLSDIARIEFNAPGKVSMLRGRFQGKWKVGDGVGGTFFITLNHDGSAFRSTGSEHGTWSVVNGEARISWDDGWHDVIRRRGGKYQKAAYAPGRSFSDEPSNVAEAVPTEPI
jgi:hypothetical protein